MKEVILKIPKETVGISVTLLIDEDSNYNMTCRTIGTENVNNGYIEIPLETSEKI